MIGKLLARLFGKRGNVAVLPANDQKASAPSREELLDELRAYIRRDLASGFYTRDEALQNAVDYLADEDGFAPGELEREAARLLPEVAAELQAQQQGWPEMTDCDRLDAAFATLEARGVICRQNFTCCGTCGSAEIWDEMEAVHDAGGLVTGYAFYHQQDTESAVDGYGMYLNYGATEEGEKPALAIASEIVAELEAHGLSTDWSGSWSERIGVQLDWKRRIAT